MKAGVERYVYTGASSLGFDGRDVCHVDDGSGSVVVDGSFGLLRLDIGHSG